MEIIESPGALYPVCLQKGALPDLIMRQFRGVSHRRFERQGDVYYTFPIWHAERLANMLGEPSMEAGKGALKRLREQRQLIESIRAGNHPLIEAAPKYFYKHQKISFAIALAARTWAFFLDPGLGKTALVIEIMRIQQRKCRTLIVCPVPLIRNTWIPELAMRSPELTYANLNENPELSKFHHDVYLLNNQLLIRRREYFRVMLAGNIGRIVIDESSMIKSDKAKITRIMHEDYGAIQERYALSGTPAPNGVHEYWGQISFIRPGLLPLTYSEFTNSWFSTSSQGKPKISDENKAELMQLISSCSIVIRKDDTDIDFPQKNFIPRYCELPTEPTDVAKAYRQIRDELKQELLEIKGFGQRMGKIFSRIMKLRELTSGFIVTKNEKGNSVWKLVSTHKFEALEAIFQELEGRQVVVWMNFVEDFRAFARLFPKRAERAGFIYGEIQDHNYRQRVISDFKAGKLQYLLANPHSIQHGLTLFDPKRESKCSDAVYFDIDYSLEAFLQSQDRLHRIGQNQHVNYWMLLCSGTIDIEMYRRLINKREDFDDAMEFLK